MQCRKLPGDHQHHDGDLRHHGGGDREGAVLRRWYECSNQERPHTNTTLIGIKSQTHFNVIYSDMPMYRDRYASTVPALPCVRLQAVSQDEPVAEYAGVNVPMTADALAKGLNGRATSAECLRRRACPQPQPQPTPDLDPTPQPIVPPPLVPKPRNLTWLLLGVLAIIGAGLGAAKHFSDVYHGRRV